MSFASRAPSRNRHQRQKLFPANQLQLKKNMDRSLNSGFSGIQAFQGKLDVIGNNIANSNTLGFKSGRADFEDSFSQSLSGGTTDYQIGTGVSTATVRSNFTQGTLSRTM